MRTDQRRSLRPLRLDQIRPPVSMMLEEQPAVFHLHKDGSAPDEYEDAWSVEVGSDGFLRAAVSDGSTEAAFAGRWARYLVQEFVADAHWSSGSPRWLERAGRRFRASIDIASLPWYIQEKTGEGSFATLLGLTLDLGRGRYRALAVGDTCLVVVRADAIANFVPPQLAASAMFGSRPYLVSSNPARNDGLHQQMFKTGYRSLIRKPTEFLLMTDALAAWFAREREAGKEPWRVLDKINSADDFQRFIDVGRSNREMRNDDVTLMRVRVISRAKE